MYWRWRWAWTVGIALGGRLINSSMVAQTRTTGTPFSAVPGAIGAEDVSGPYGYVAEVDAGRFQKFRPRPGANPATLIGNPVYSAWK